MMSDIHGDPRDAIHVEAAPNAGPAPVPYGGGHYPEPPVYAADLGPLADAAAHVMAGVTDLGTTESPAAHDIAAGTADAPYYPGSIDPINAAGDDDPGGRSDVAASVAGAVANATARWQNLQGDLGAGGTIGDLMTFPAIGEDPGAGVGNTLPTQGFYDPPRGYGGTEGAPGYGIGGVDEPPPGQQGAPQ